MFRGWITCVELLVLVVAVYAAYEKGVSRGEDNVQTKWNAAISEARAANLATERARQADADEASKEGTAALATVEDDAAGARSAGDRLRRQLADATRRAEREGTELAGERKAAADRERVYTELLARSTTAIEFYAREADRSRAAGLICARAWPKK